MKKILKGLVKMPCFNCFVSLFSAAFFATHVQADEDEVEYSLPSMLVTFLYMMMVMRRLLRK